MRSIVLAVLLVVTPLAAGVYAADTMAVDVDPYVKVATARAKAEIAMRDGMVQFDMQNNSWNASWQGIEITWNKIWRMLEDVRNLENQKGDQADRQFVNDVQAKQETVRADYDALGRVEGKRSLAEQKIRDAQRQWENLGSVFANIRGIEEQWKNSKLELSLLVTYYASIETRAIEIRGQAAAAVGMAKAAKADWEAKFSEVEKLVAGRLPAAK